MANLSANAYGIGCQEETPPQVTPSMRNALADLKLQKLYFIHAGDQSFPMHKQIYAIGLKRLLTDLKLLSL